MEKLMSVEVKRMEDSWKVSKRKGKEKLVIASKDGASQAQDMDVDIPPQPQSLDLIVHEKAFTA
jgi:hypothetical protein